MFSRNKKDRRSRNNKGFSLVELIVVIAIMAVLVAVLAPQFTKYIDQSRKSNDAATVSGIVTAAQVGIADTSFGVPEDTYTITIASDGTTIEDTDASGDTNAGKLEDAIKAACGDLKELKITSKNWGTNAGDSSPIIVKLVYTNGAVTLDYSQTPKFESYVTGTTSAENEGNN